MVFFGTCLVCKEDKEIVFGNDANDVVCKECFDIRNTRCFSFAAVFSESGHLLQFGSSHVDYYVENKQTTQPRKKKKTSGGCAERRALWKLDVMDTSPKTMVVCRVNRRRNQKIAFSNSKPCLQCIFSFKLYNVTRICYSLNKKEFKWENAEDIQNDVSTCSKVIVKF